MADTYLDAFRNDSKSVEAGRPIYDAFSKESQADYDAVNMIWREQWKKPEKEGGYSIEEKAEILDFIDSVPQLPDSYADSFYDFYYSETPTEDAAKINILTTPLGDEKISLESDVFVGNFLMNNPDKAARKLQEDNPDLEYVRWRDNKLVAKPKGQTFEQEVDIGPLEGNLYPIAEATLPPLADLAVTLKTKKPALGTAAGATTAAWMQYGRGLAAEEDPEMRDIKTALSGAGYGMASMIPQGGSWMKRKAQGMLPGGKMIVKTAKGAKALTGKAADFAKQTLGKRRATDKAQELARREARDPQSYTEAIEIGEKAWKPPVRGPAEPNRSPWAGALSGSIGFSAPRAIWEYKVQPRGGGTSLPPRME